MPLLRILKDCTGSPDGIASQAFKAGEVTDVTPHLAPILIDAGWAVEAAATPAPIPAPTAPVVAPDSFPTDDDTLPADFPAREALVAAGLETLSAVAALSKDELIALPRIGKAAASRILAALES